MTHYKGEIASDRKDQDGGYFSNEALQQLTKHIANVPVRWEFRGDVVGRGSVEGTQSTKGKVSALIESPGNLAGWYAVPQIEYDPNEQELNEDGSVRVYRNIRLISLGLTRAPADPNLTPLTVVSEKPRESE